MSNRVFVRSGGNLLTIIESFVSLEWTRRFTTLGSMTMRVHRKIDGAEFLVDSIGLEISVIDTPGQTDPDLTYVIESLRFTVGEGGLSDDMIEVTAIEGGLFHMRICLPPPHDLPLSGVDSHHEISASDAESAMREVVDNNVGPSADAKRQFPNLTLGTNLNRGPTRDWLARFEVLDKKLTEWAEIAGLGWEVQYDAATGNHIFNVLQGTDVSASVHFAIRLDNVKNQQWTIAGQDQASVAYVAGTGEGVARLIDEAWNGAEPSGLDRREIFVDAQDLTDSGDLEPKGLEVLAERAIDETFEVDIDPEVMYTYRTDWDLGDVVTVKNAEWNIEKTKAVVEVKSMLDSNSGRVERSIVLGRAPKTLKKRIGEQLAELATARQ